MCGRFTLATPADAVADLFGLAEVPDLPARYNVAPTQLIACVRGDKDDRALAMLRWGLIPSWAKDAKIAHSLINARCETVAEKPAFRSAFKKRRCLIPADGFYEWARDSKPKQGYHFHRRDHGPFAFAGLWETWTNPDEKPVETCTIITTAANEIVAPFHERMPVVLDRTEFDSWLNPAPPSAGVLAELFRPYSASAMEAVPVSPLVNSPKNEGPELLAPA